jgi:hypothetical protein
MHEEKLLYKCLTFCSFNFGMAIWLVGFLVDASRIGGGFSIEWFEVAILDGLLLSLVQPHTKKPWHLYRKSGSHKGGMEEA